MMLYKASKGVHLPDRDVNNKNDPRHPPAPSQTHSAELWEESRPSQALKWFRESDGRKIEVEIERWR